MKIIINGKQFDTEGHTGIQVSTPTCVFEEIPIIHKGGTEGYIAGSHKWEPLVLNVVDICDKKQPIRLRNIAEYLRAHTGCHVELHTTTQMWKLNHCWLMIPYNKKLILNMRISFSEALLTHKNNKGE